MSKTRRARRPRSIRILAALSIVMLAACSDGRSTTSETTNATPTPNPKAAAVSESIDEGSTIHEVAAPRVHAAGETAPRNPNERPVPAFDGITLAGTKLSMRDLLGSRVVLFFFNPEVDPASAISDAVAAIHQQSGAHNFEVLGIGVGSDPATLSRFVQARGLKFPVIDDSNGVITNLFRLRAPNAIMGIDAEGYLTFATATFPSEGDVRTIAEADLRQHLRLPEPGIGASGGLYAYPAAPELGVIAMSNGARLETRDLSGRAAIVIFFLHTCPHCHHALASIKTALQSIPSEQRPRLVAISIQDAPAAIRQALKEQGLDYFDPYLDPGQKATERWGVTGGVPVVVILDTQGRIRHRSSGWDDRRDPGLVKMKAASAAGARVAMLLEPNGYSGNDVCGTCHEQQYATWQYSAHSTAFNTLVAHAADRRTDCVGCHVVGFEQPGGYDFRSQHEHLENVGCESCHGRGGPHLTPSFVPKTASGTPDYAQVCATCHNPKHSLGFDYASFHPRISHTVIAGLSDAARSELLGGAGPKRDLLPTQADHVGSSACQSCHQAEFATWQSSPHAHAVKSLEKAGKAHEPANADCLACHTTAYGKTGGFKVSVSIAAQPDLARVGCESCHGPGGDHVGATARRVGTILSLGDKCDSCVILKICGSCHDDANDPGFQFKVEERIDAQRHGTREASSTRVDESADRVRLHGAVEALAKTGVVPTSRSEASRISPALGIQPGRDPS